MDSKNDNSLSLKCFIDDNHYYYLKEKLSEMVDNEEFTDVLLTTSKDVKYVKKVHGLILDCFCDLSNLLNVSENECFSEKNLKLHHETDVIDYMIVFLYWGKGIVPVAKLTEFVDLANYLKVSPIFVYDEFGSDYFIYLMEHKNKFLNYIGSIKKKFIKCDIYIISQDHKCIPSHISIIALYSKKLFYYFKNRISTKNSIVLYLPSNSKELEKIIDFCYYGRVVLKESDIEELSEVVNFLGMERFLEKCKLIKNKLIVNGEANFSIIGPSKYSNPIILEKIMSNNSNCYVYFWMRGTRCFIVPVVCLQLLKFRFEHKQLKNIACYDVIVCLRNVTFNKLKKFIYCLYTGEFSSETEPLIEIFDIDCSHSDQKNFPCKPEYRKAQLEVNCTPLFANNIDDLKTICDTVFKDQSRIEETIIQVFSCQTCDEKLLSRRALSLHLREHNNIRYLCERCGMFICQNYFPKHLKRHGNCIPLKRKTHDQSNEIKKMKQHTFNYGTKFDCDLCEKNFKSLYWLQKHLMKHNSSEQSLESPSVNISKDQDICFRCPECTVKFKTKLLLEKHILKQHSIKALRCNSCGKVFSSMAALRVHERTHSREKLFQCRVCDKRFTRLDSLDYHFGKEHELKKYICPVCYKDYTSRSSFLEHGWLAHRQFYDPNLHVMKKGMIIKDEDDLSELDPQDLSKQVIIQPSEFSENSPSIHFREANDFENNSNASNPNNVPYSCPICYTLFQNFNELIFHLDNHL